MKESKELMRETTSLLSIKKARLSRDKIRKQKKPTNLKLENAIIFNQ
jgi:hypothetical protein